MRVEAFELEVVLTEGAGASRGALQEVFDAGSQQTFVIAAPGQAFDIRCSYLGPPLPAGLAYLFTAKVDGQCVGTSRVFTAPGSQTFRGFFEAGDVVSTTYRSFKFATAHESEEAEAHSLEFAEGRITAEVHNAFLGGMRATTHAVGRALQDTRIARLPEGKKFFMAPSLTTACGARQDCSEGLSQVKWERVGPPVASFCLRYETASTLLLRGVLRRSNPAHRAILDSFDETRHQGAEGEEEEEGCDAGPSSRGIKREWGGGGAPRGQPRTEIVDLTIDSDDEVLAAKERGETLNCDMTGTGEGGRWRAEKRRAVDLTVGEGNQGQGQGDGGGE